MRSLFVSNGFGIMTKQAFVEFSDQAAQYKLQISPNEARKLAYDILTAAEAADQDAFMIDFFKEKIECDDQTAYQVVGDFRRWKDARR